MGSQTICAQDEIETDGQHSFQIPEPEKPFWKSAQDFVDAYADRDAQAIGQLFTKDAEFLDELGVRTHGRDSIISRFNEAFSISPDVLIESIDITSVKYLGDSVALEEGFVISSESVDHARTSNRYAAIHQKGEDGNWRIAVLKDFPREDLGRGEQLVQLSWMVGDWVNESANTIVETSCQWSDDGNYLLRKFVVKTADGREMSGVQRTGWDPIHKKLRAWTFDSEGGFFNGFWTRTDDGWLLTSAGVSSEGETVTSSAIYHIVSAERLIWNYQSLIVGDEIRESHEPVTMVRKSPKPALNLSKTK
ncbi:SgcJ/EcaC family oxidoreductase [bacterium]|nr:SgcJ/EcaC family oxidoreductase [bacterium]